MLRETIASDIAELDTGLLDWNVDPLEGVPADFLLVPDYQRLETPEDGRRMVARWRAMAVYTDRHLDSLRRSLVEGRVACLAPGERTVAILEHLLDGETGGLAAARAAGRRRRTLDGWSAADRDRFTADLDAGRRRRDPAGVHPAARRARDRDPAATPAPRSGRACATSRRVPTATGG